MRQFSGGATVTKTDRGVLRLIVSNPTGETIFHDLTPVEVDAFREMFPPAEPPAEEPEPAAPAAKTPRRYRAGKET